MEKSGEKTGFSESAELRRIFRLQYEKWRQREHGSMEELAARLGVSNSYLGQIARYGRVPGRPVLLLLALNFQMKDPESLFAAAGLSAEEWPYPRGNAVRPPSAEESGFLQLKVDMQGFTSAIQDIIRAELRPRSVGREASRRQLRIGFNTGHKWFFKDTEPDADGRFSGLFPELFRMLGAALHNKVEVQVVSYTDYRQMLSDGQLDIYGPILSLPERQADAIHSARFCEIGLSALVRKRPIGDVAPLPPPTSLKDLKSRPYEIAILRNSIAHHFAASRLNRLDSSLIFCDSYAEAVERTLLSTLEKPADIALLDSLSAITWHQKNPDMLDLCFATKDTLLAQYDDTIAVRADWPELSNLLDEAVESLVRNGTIRDLFQRWVPEEYIGEVVFPRETIER